MGGAFLILHANRQPRLAAGQAVNRQPPTVICHLFNAFILT